jgi:hypothetical protein
MAGRLSSEQYLWLRFCASRRRVATSWRTRRRASDALCKETRFMKSITLHGSALARQQTTCREERLERWGVCLSSWRVDAGAVCRTQRHGAIGWRSSTAAPSKHVGQARLCSAPPNQKPAHLFGHHHYTSTMSLENLLPLGRCIVAGRACAPTDDAQNSSTSVWVRRSGSS